MISRIPPCTPEPPREHPGHRGLDPIRFREFLRVRRSRHVNIRAIAAWTLYDFANSSFAAVVFATIYAAYYAMSVVGNATGAGDLWWGRVISVSMAVVAVSSPLLGGVADRAGI